MAAIARSVVLGFVLGAALNAADDRAEITDALAAIAADLSSANADGILKRVDQAMPGRDTLEQNLRGLLQVAQVATTIEAREWKTAGARTTVTLDWFLELRRSGDNSLLATQRRRQLVEAAWEKQGKRWKLVALKPIEFFAPPPSQ